MGAGSIIAAKSEAFTHYDAKDGRQHSTPSSPRHPHHRRKPTIQDLAARLAARRGLSVVKMRWPSTGTTSPRPSTPARPCRRFPSQGQP